MKKIITITLLFQYSISFSQVKFDTGSIQLFNKQPLSYYKTIENDTNLYLKNNIPYSGKDSLYFFEIYNHDLDKNIILQDSFLFIITYKTGYKIKVEEFYKSGESHKIIQFSNGLKYGKVVSFYKSGSIKSYVNYYSGKQNGPEIWYYENGKIKTYLNFTKNEDKLNPHPWFNIISHWYEDGSIRDEWKPVSGGKEEAINDTKYYKNGNIQAKFIGNNGKQHFLHFYENGKKNEDGYIIDAPWSRVGKWEEWYENGMLKREIHYNDSIPNYREGIWKWWDEKGNLIKQEIYENDVLKETKEFMPPQKNKNQ